MTTPALTVTDLHVGFSQGRGQPEVRALRGLDFAVRPGEILGIVGESGSGKTTAALALMGLLPQYARVTGSVRLGERELLGLSDAEFSAHRGKDIALVPADPLAALTPVYGVGRQIAEAVGVHDPGLSRAQRRERACALLDRVRFPDPERWYAAMPHQLSGGMRQRAIIAMALAHDPAVIIADEPTASVDASMREHVLRLLADRRSERSSLVLITHDLGAVSRLADRVLVTYGGRAVEEGPTHRLLRQPRMPYTIGLLAARPRLGAKEELVQMPGSPPTTVEDVPGCSFVDRCPVAVSRCGTETPPMTSAGEESRAACWRVEEFAGAKATDIFPSSGPAPRSAPRGTPRERRAVLRVEGLVRRYRSVGMPRWSPLLPGIPETVAVDGVHLRVGEGETLAVAGESGSGKTTLLREILSFDRPQRGRVEVLGRDTGELNRRDRFGLRRQVQVVLQDPGASLDPRMRILDTVMEPLRTHRGDALRREGRDVRFEDRALELLTLVGLSAHDAGRYPEDLSSGMRQRVAIARAVALRPSVLVLDEPVSGLDVSVQAGILGLLDGLKDRLGLSYLMVSHDLAVVRQVADRLAVMHRGRIVETGPTDTVLERGRHPHTRALVRASDDARPARPRQRDGREARADAEPPPDATVDGQHAPAEDTGCRFWSTCGRYAALPEGSARLCRTVVPRAPSAVPESGHSAACHYVP
ncbi:ABC transporter ATP-binding protein [Spiractinospora alimapuensis]|uniref:dipeptide ABC transporter ATP-binding protein n=1 Tax=Spiractinospora alimapuensis TaxID=2820884 RepID=UPI001F26D8C2|nr:ABC transporter ATP-binding protein [Spiractinospora alimapuensis]QVQ51713.1 ABC transporter ATP-binding protein [Spiractinospora alimapuensis]